MVIVLLIQVGMAMGRRGVCHPHPALIPTSFGFEDPRTRSHEDQILVLIPVPISASKIVMGRRQDRFEESSSHNLLILIMLLLILILIILLLSECVRGQGQYFHTRLELFWRFKKIPEPVKQSPSPPRFRFFPRGPEPMEKLSSLDPILLLKLGKFHLNPEGCSFAISWQ